MCELGETCNPATSCTNSMSLCPRDCPVSLTVRRCPTNESLVSASVPVVSGSQAVLSIRAGVVLEIAREGGDPMASIESAIACGPAACSRLCVVMAAQPECTLSMMGYDSLSHCPSIVQVCGGHGRCLGTIMSTYCECNTGYKGAACESCERGYLSLGSRCVFAPGAMASCSAGVWNGYEDGVDCGGSCAAQCVLSGSKASGPAASVVSTSNSKPLCTTL